MTFNTIINPEDLSQYLNDPDWVVMDCRFDLDHPDLGLKSFQAGHIPGAQYANLDLDLSSPVIPGKTGRHPLPDVNTFVKKLSDWGIDERVQVVVYDSHGGGLAVRLWWLLRWLGHENAAVLNGGWPAWENNEYSIEKEVKKKKARTFKPVENAEMIADLDFVEDIREDQDFLLVDSRSAERYWGLKETKDVRAGHIPGAVSFPFEGNLDENGIFHNKETLKERFTLLLDGLPADQVIFYCGSGVTAGHNILSMVAAGFDMPKLYPGSWSEWIADPERPGAP